MAPVVTDRKLPVITGAAALLESPRQRSPRAGGAPTSEGAMPMNHVLEVLRALAYSASIVRSVLYAFGWWKENKHKSDDLGR